MREHRSPQVPRRARRARPSRPRRLAVALAALVLAASAPAAHAVMPVARVDGSAALTSLSASGSARSPAVFHVHVAFSTDTPGAQAFTIQKAVIFFPDHSGTNGSLFPSCSAAQIAHFRGDVRRCPKGSKVGSGTVRAQALQLGVTATGHVTMFSSQHGKAITFNIQTYLPAYINQSIDAPIEQLHHGAYGEKLTLAVPHSLQEILSGVFVAVRDFDVTVTGATSRRGVTYSYLKAPRCPRHALHAVFDFEDWTTGQRATTATDAKVRCRAR